MNDNLISIQDLKVHYSVSGGFLKPKKKVKAVDGISLDIKKGETLGLVGESGCGKSTLGKAILRLTEPTSGKVIYQDKKLVDKETNESLFKLIPDRTIDLIINCFFGLGIISIIFWALTKLFSIPITDFVYYILIGLIVIPLSLGILVKIILFFIRSILNYRSLARMHEQRKNLQMIFQDPYASLNPRMTVGQIIGEPIKNFGLVKGNLKEQVQELMETVGLSRRFINRYPHEFSGGQRQRIGIARALAVNPQFIVADEPISALDVSIQAQIMNLMERLQHERELTYLFISHDLRAIRHLSDRVAVMYLGKIVELADAKEVYKNPLHPYSKALISAVPVPDPEIEAKRERIILKGDVPSPINPPSGCHFHTRCAYATEDCKKTEQKLVEITKNHFVACSRINAEQPNVELAI